MCCDLMNTERDIRKLEKGGVDWFHLDVMDAHFVPNLTFGPDFINSLRKVSDIPFDVHLMLEDPEFIIGCLNLSSQDYVTLHSELPEEVIRKNIRLIRKKGAHVGMALNPETPVEALEKYIEDLDLILLMLVKPGFAGGCMIEGIMDKVKTTRDFVNKNTQRNILISTDGNITLERAKFMASIGADVFVGGTSAIFRKGMDIEETVQAFHKYLEE